MGTRNRYPFTAPQWEEFEQQALIYKYMLAGVPLPSHLLYSLKRNLDYSSTLVLPTRGWGGIYGENEMVGAASAGCMSYGWGDRKIDPEPGRCRRTDGKKWRCSKEAHPDSKYCERHMHRGRNKTNHSCSRKPVEIQFTGTTAATTTTAATAISASTINHSANTPRLSSSSSYITPLSSSVIPTSVPHDHQNPLLYPSLHHSHSSSSSRPPTHPQLLMGTTMAYSRQDKDHRYQQEMRDLQREDKRALFTGTSRSVQGLEHDPYYTTPKMDPSHHFNFHNLVEKSKQDEGQHCYVLGTDVRSAPNNRSITQEEEMGTDQDNLNKRFHHFFSDWPQPTPEASRDSATCLDEIVDDPSHKPISTSNQLSVSMPLSTQDFFQSKPTYW